MRSVVNPVKAVSFFLPGALGDLFAVYYPPSCEPVRGGLLYVHPFAEEAHFSYLVIAAVARAITRLGYGVLTVDLYGCGDSAGEFRDALWANWHQDLALGVKWLQDHDLPNVGLWGLRLGGLLALDFAIQFPRTFPFIVLWHPPSSGAETLKQFLRLSFLQEAAGSGGSSLTTKDLRRRLAAGACVEIIGWELNPDVASAMERLELSPLISQVSSTIYCVEFLQGTNPAVAPSRRRILQACKKSGRAFDFRQLPVRAFWASRAKMTDDSQILIELMNSILTR